MNRTGLDQAIDRSCWYMCQNGGLLGREHDGVASRAVAAKRRQRAARGADGIEFMNLDCLFSPARLFHDVSPLSTSAGWSIAVIAAIRGRPYNWRDL